jgi:hypothetical protein
MDLVHAALWGLLGSGALEGLQFIADSRRVGDWPWRAKGWPGPGLYLCTALIRVAVGAIVAGALGASHQIDTAIAALFAGIGAPLLVQKAAAEGASIAAKDQNVVTKKQHMPADLDVAQLSGSMEQWTPNRYLPATQEASTPRLTQTEGTDAS